MTPTRGYFAIIQFQPDPYRQEGANVGVALCVPGVGVFVRFATKNEQVKRRFRKTAYDDTRLTSEKEGVAKRLTSYDASPDALTLAACDEVGAVRILPQQLVVVEESVEATLAFLFDSLVSDPAQRTRQTFRGPDIAPHFDPLMGHLPIERRVTVRLPYLRDTFVADYAFRNGARNLIHSWHFGAKEREVMRNASEIGSRGLILSKHPDGPIRNRLTVVGAVSSNLRGEVRDLLGEHETDFVPYEEIDGLVERVRRTAHN